MPALKRYIYQHEQWPNFHWHYKQVEALLGEVRFAQGKLLGLLSTIGFALRGEAKLSSLTMEVMQTSAIEGEHLDQPSVRSSIANKLGLEHSGLTATQRHEQGIVDVVLDATQRFSEPLTTDRLFAWHGALFPTGRSGLYKIEVAKWRSGHMQIVSGATGKEKLHYEAPPAEAVPQEMERFLAWYNSPGEDLVLKAAIAHFWFIIIHPFHDGNGRIGRALADLLLARAEGTADRVYSMSAQIMQDRKVYYNVLQKVQYSSGDITEWLLWYLQTMQKAVSQSHALVIRAQEKQSFWHRHERTAINQRQRLMINKLFDGIEGRLQTSKWAKRLFKNRKEVIW